MKTETEDPIIMKYWEEMVRRGRCSAEFKKNKDWKMLIQFNSEITGNLSENSLTGEVGI